MKIRSVFISLKNEDKNERNRKIHDKMMECLLSYRFKIN